MFEVMNKETRERYTVYEVRTDKTGYPHFLIHDNEIWVWKSAKYFVPVTK